MNEDSFASRIRRFFEDLFYSKLVDQLREDLLCARADIEKVRQEYQSIVADVRSEKAILTARLAMYEAKSGLRPPSETPKKPNFGVDFMTTTLPKSRWDVVREEHEAKIAKELEEEAEIESKKAVATAT